MEDELDEHLLAALQMQNEDTESMHADENLLAAQRMRFSEELAAEPERVDVTFPLPPPSHWTLPPVASTSQERSLQPARSEPLVGLRDAREQETEARRRLYKLKREMTMAKSESALRSSHERRRALAPSPEADRSKAPVMMDAPRASDEAVREVAALLHVRMRQIGSESAGGERKHDSWFKLFKHMDDDGSGKVAYVEFEGLVRQELLLTPKELPEPALKAVWVALDNDGSGSITVGEFGAFMRKGKGNEPSPLTWRAKVEAQKRASGDSVRAARRKQKGSSLLQEAAQAGLRASEPEVCMLSELMHASLREKFLAPSERSWFKLYKTVEAETLTLNPTPNPANPCPDPNPNPNPYQVEADGSGPASGVVTYEEFCRMVEQESYPTSNSNSNPNPDLAPHPNTLTLTLSLIPHPKPDP